MAHCPVCNAPIADDFGLLECASCSAQLIVHMDGRVEHAGVDFGEAAPELDNPLGAASEASDNLSAQFPDPNSELANISAMPLDEAEAGVEAEAEAEQPLDLFSGDDSAQPTTEVYSTPLAPQASDSPDLSDIARFGNSDISVRDGSLRYNLYITGIDTADVREAFREAITDRKLVWDIDQILRSLKNGEVQIQNVTPPKAHIVISRLRSIPVQVRWEQYAISQA